MALTVAEFNSIADPISQFCSSVYGSAGSNYGYGDGTFGASKAALDMKAAIVATFASVESIDVVNTSVINLSAYSTFNLKIANDLSDIISRLRANFASAGLTGVTDLETWLSYQNVGGGGTWLALQHPFFRTLQEALNTSGIQVYNYYQEILQTGAGNAMGKLVVGGAFTDGTAVDVAHYAGGFPKLKVVGLVGNGLVTVTGNAYDPVTKAVVAARTWSFNVVANGTFALNPLTAPANSLITDVTGIAVAGTLTGGTIYVEAWRPNGRTQIL